MNRFRVAVEKLSPGEVLSALDFDVEIHDDVIAIADRFPSRFGLDPGSTKSMVLGAKLLSEIVLKHRHQSPFRELRPALRDFTLALKQQSDPEMPSMHE